MDATLHADADAITQLLYDGIVDSGDWYAGVELLRARMGAAFFHQMTVDCANGTVSDGLATFEAPQDKAREYEQHYARTDERMHAVLAMPAGSMVIDHERFDTSAMSSSAIYSDWLPSVGLRHTVGLTLREDGARKEVIGIMRAREDGMFRASEIALCQRAACARCRPGGPGQVRTGRAGRAAPGHRGARSAGDGAVRQSGGAGAGRGRCR